MILRLLHSVVLSLLVLTVWAQTKVSGRVVDGKTGEPLPFVTIKGIPNPVGTNTDFDGYYSFETEARLDSLQAIFMGYETSVMPVINGSAQTIDFTMYQAANIIATIEVRASDVNPGEIIMRKASRRKKLYNPDKIEFYEYESYTKVQLAVDNVSDRFKKRRLFKDIEPLFDTISSFSDSSANKVLPVFISESISDYYYRKFPRRTKEFIKATKLKGVGIDEDSYVSQLLGSTFQQYNFYVNNLYILDKDFVSPLSVQANAYYNFQLMDSMLIDSQLCFRIKVEPKNEKDLVFRGQIWITTETYAIKQLILEITDEANLNFIEELKISQTMKEVEKDHWLPEKTRVLIDVAEVSKNTLGMIGLYYTAAKDIKINNVRNLSFYEEKVAVQENSHLRSDEYWDSARFEKISADDKKVYKMVDSLKNQPLLRTYVETVNILVNGFIPNGKIEWGPFHYFLGYNQLEGMRTQIGFRTTPEFHKDFQVRLYGAYGFKDKRFKYGISSQYVINRKKWFKVGYNYKDDVELIGVTDEDYGTLALFDAFATFGNNQLSRSFNHSLWMEKELFKGYTQQIYFNNKQYIFEKLGDYHFIYKEPGTNNYMSSFNISSIRLRGKLSHKQQFLIRRTERLNFGHLKAPVLTIDYTHGFKDVLGGDFNFDKLGLEVWQFNSLANIGNFEYTFKAYKVFGTLPYPTLFVLRGNESPISNPITYNLMNWFEFAADQYVSFDYEHQFNGLLLNRIPLLNRLKWRSFANTRAVYGTMSQANQSLMDTDHLGGTNPTLFSRNIPYVEAGYGIENIFKFLRVDFIHRLTYVDQTHVDARPFGVKATAKFRF